MMQRSRKRAGSVLLAVWAGFGAIGNATGSGPTSGPAVGEGGRDESADVVVYGGTSAGVMAAVQVARLGHSVILVSPRTHLGGLTSHGLGATDLGNKSAIGGLAREFYARVARHYGQDSAWTYGSFDEYRKGPGQRYVDDGVQWSFEPHVAEHIFEVLLEEAGVRVLRDAHLDRARDVPRADGRITGLPLKSGSVIDGRVFLDATYEGDLMAAAGVSYRVGREANAEHDETLNGVQVAHARHHQFDRPVDPYVEPGNPDSGLLPGIEGGGPGVDGAGDARVQAFCFRLCTTDVPDNRVPWPRPDDYDEGRYELLLRTLEAGDHRHPWNPIRMPNGKTDTNNNFAVSLDNIGQNHSYPEASDEDRARIFAEHRSYQQGLLWTLASHERVPESIRQEFQRWGLCADEFTDHGHWPRELYVREARRMVGEYIMTEHDCMGRRAASDGVGMGAYTMDSHHVRRYVDANGHVRNEGDVQVRVPRPYAISYRSLVPKTVECTNLLVPVCLSATHIAFGSIRMEPVFMILGQSAANAAVLAIENDCDVQAVPYQTLRARLLEQGQVLNAQLAGIRRDTLMGLVIDNLEAQTTGQWVLSTSVPSFVESDYLHDGNQHKGELTAVFPLEVAEQGRYELRLSYSPHPNRARQVPILIRHAAGEQRVEVDQQQVPPLQGTWVSLGVFPLEPGQPARIVVSNEGTEGYVVVDAVQVVPVKG